MAPYSSQLRTTKLPNYMSISTRRVIIPQRRAAGFTTIHRVICHVLCALGIVRGIVNASLDYGRREVLDIADL